MIDYAAIMLRRHAGRQWSLNGDEYEGLVMLDDGEKPSKKSLDDAWPAVQKEIVDEHKQRQNARASALNKLKDLGLTDAEVAALVG